MKKNSYNNRNRLHFFLLRKEAFEYLNFKAPTSLLKFKDIIDFGLTATSNSLLLLHYQSNTLIEVDFNGVEFQEYQLQTDLMKNFSNAYYHTDRMSNSIQDNMRTAYKSSENFGLTFDPYKKITVSVWLAGRRNLQRYRCCSIKFYPSLFYNKHLR